MNSNRLRITCLAVTGLLLPAGCQRVPKPVARPVEGTSVFSFVERPLVASTGAAAQVMAIAREPVDVKVKAEPIEPLATPVYPSVALGRVRMPMTVGVRINVDATGRVAHVGASLAALSSGGEFGEEFRSAVEDALAQWRFKPAELRHMVPRTGASGLGGYWQITRTQPTDDAFDLSFTFTSKGDVLAEGWR